jgi:hypothetical protein
VRFSTVDLVKAGWMLKDKGIWSATEIGKAAFDELSDPTAFYKRAVELYHAWKAAQPKGAESSTDEESADIIEQLTTSASGCGTIRAGSSASFRRTAVSIRSLPISRGAAWM